VAQKANRRPRREGGDSGERGRRDGDRQQSTTDATRRRGLELVGAVRLLAASERAIVRALSSRDRAELLRHLPAARMALEGLSSAAAGRGSALEERGSMVLGGGPW
jgi:hypothetical protein